MAQGRSSAMLVTLLLCLLVLHYSNLAHAATYTVGDARGWTFDRDTWFAGKHFKAGDILVFKYNPANHNVVVVNEAGYDRCMTPQGAKVYQTGNDKIKLVRGKNFFICNSRRIARVACRSL
ncbi:basic blue protein-like isoform X2 [Punica granatum]|uniref:Basic blue protein n=1 Tax=Punica granatum TaxID=22663 RepID=A0A6P8D2R3_PUNGR|nr:basic blue protein-like isoform X2 [Punica granatum]